MILLYLLRRTSRSRSPHSVYNPFLLNAFQMLHVSASPRQKDKH